jgi:Flp pilus assembly pilin Flp
MLRQLWRDDRGAVISTELTIVLGVLTFGVVPGLVALRNGINRGLTASADVLGAVVPDMAEVQAKIAAPPSAAKTLSHSQSQSNATAYSVSGSHTNVYVNVQIPSRADIPSP